MWSWQRSTLKTDVLRCDKHPFILKISSGCLNEVRGFVFISPHFTQHWRVFISHSKRKKVKELIHSRQLSGTIYVTLRHNLGAKYQPKSGTGQGSTCNTESRNKIPPQQKLSKMEVSFTPDNQNHPEPRPGLFHWTIPVHKVPKQNGPRQ